MKRILLVGMLALAACGTPTQTSPTISLSALPVQSAPTLPEATPAPSQPAQIAVATETAVRITEAPTTTAAMPVLGPENNWGFPYPIMHRDFDPHWDCSTFDAWLTEHGMTPIDKAHRIMQRESGCIPGVWNWHNTGPNFNDESYGLFQLNTRGSLGPALQELCGLADPVVIDGRRVYIDLFDAETNIACAGALKGEYGWKPWGG